jgi:hypothetical protein
MKHFFVTCAAVILLAACAPVVQVVSPVDDPTLYDDPRLTLIDAMDAKFLRPPAGRGIAEGDPIAAYCTDPGWSYIFYDDQAVIGYEPFPDAVDVMHRAVAITVESHNLEYPEAPWDFINVAIPVTPPDTSNDPVLGVWQVALCLDDGTIVAGPYTAEYDFNWAAFKTTIPREVESYNMEHPDNQCHAVWGPDA